MYLPFDFILVAKQVQTVIKHIRESVIGGALMITPDTTSPSLSSSMEMQLYLKENQLEYLEEKKIKEIKKCSKIIPNMH